MHTSDTWARRWQLFDPLLRKSGEWFESLRLSHLLQKYWRRPRHALVRWFLAIAEQIYPDTDSTEHLSQLVQVTAPIFQVEETEIRLYSAEWEHPLEVSDNQTWPESGLVG